ncbi:MAG: hypothetical protein ACRC3A_07645, partial [Culicoidibacterales bacterium]
QYANKNECIDEILQVEKIQPYLNALSVQTLQEFCIIDDVVNQNKIKKAMKEGNRYEKANI